MNNPSTSPQNLVTVDQVFTSCGHFTNLKIGHVNISMEATVLFLSRIALKTQKEKERWSSRENKVKNHYRKMFTDKGSFQKFTKLSNQNSVSEY